MIDPIFRKKPLPELGVCRNVPANVQEEKAQDRHTGEDDGEESQKKSNYGNPPPDLSSYYGHARAPDQMRDAERRAKRNHGSDDGVKGRRQIREQTVSQPPWSLAEQCARGRDGHDDGIECDQRSNRRQSNQQIKQYSNGCGKGVILAHEPPFECFAGDLHSVACGSRQETHYLSQRDSAFCERRPVAFVYVDFYLIRAGLEV